jgi:hypothetical protein
MKLDISEKGLGEEPPRLRLDSHQDALDYARQLVKDSDNFLAAHDATQNVAVTLQ